MFNITPHMMEKLQAVGFSYPDYEHELNLGMVYAYQGSEYYIGGDCDSDFSEEDRIVAQNGLWLPDSDQLLSWLEDNDFDLSISLNSQQRHYAVFAKDLQNNESYTGGGSTLAFALYKIIYKICKSKKRAYIPEKIIKLPIIAGSTFDKT